MLKIMIVEDDEMLNSGLTFNIEMEGFKCYPALTIKEARNALKENAMDLIILDVNLPDGNGFDFCKEVRKTLETPILFLTAEDLELDVIRGFKLGGDEYITKPFSVSILIERIKALFRRISSIKNTNIIIENGIVLDLDKMLAKKNGLVIDLSKTEFRILKMLIEHKGQAVSREDILNQVWDDDMYIEEHALTVNINRLRNKIDVGESNHKYIKTEYGLGYSFRGKDE